MSRVPRRRPVSCVPRRRPVSRVPRRRPVSRVIVPCLSALAMRWHWRCAGASTGDALALALAMRWRWHWRCAGAGAGDALARQVASLTSQPRNPFLLPTPNAGFPPLRGPNQRLAALAWPGQNIIAAAGHSPH